MEYKFITFKYDVLNYEILKEPQRIVINVAETTSLGIMQKRLFNPFTEVKEPHEAFYIRYEGSVYGLKGMTEEQYIAMTSGSRVYALNTFLNEPTAGYPVGVFNVNRKLLGNAADAAAYVALWNGDADNQKAGVLSVHPDGVKFKLAVVDRAVVPDYIWGLRYFQFDNPKDRVDTITVPHKGVIDYGNGRQVYADGNQQFDFNGVSGVYNYAGAYDGGAGHYFRYYIGNTQYYDTVVSQGEPTYAGYAQGNTSWSFGYIYPEGVPAGAPYVVTIYHNDNEYFFYNDNNYSATLCNNFVANLRGNLPKKTKGFQFINTKIASFNTFDNVNFNEFKDSVVYFCVRNGLTNWTFGATISQFKNLEALDLGLDSIADVKTFSQLLNGNKSLIALFPKLKSFGWRADYQWEAGLDLVFPNVRQFVMYYWSAAKGGTAFIDDLLIRLDAAKTDKGGVIRLHNVGTNFTSASAAARASLVAKGMTVMYV